MSQEWQAGVDEVDGGGKRLLEELGVDGTEAGEDGVSIQLPEEVYNFWKS